VLLILHGNITPPFVSLVNGQKFALHIHTVPKSPNELDEVGCLLPFLILTALFQAIYCRVLEAGISQQPLGPFYWHWSKNFVGEQFDTTAEFVLVEVFNVLEIG
jgi:hypothetical protein